MVMRIGRFLATVTATLTATLTVALAAGPAAAQAPGTAVEPSGPSVGFWIDNDLFGGGTDRYYTNGFQFYYFSGDRPAHGNIDWLAAMVPWIGPQGVRRYGFALGQNMYTPSDITRRVPNPDDRPYAGWLYGRVSLISEVPRHVDRLELDLGVVGPASLAEQTQKAVHRIVPGARWPEGWDTQLRNEPGIVLSYEHVWRDERPTRLGPFETDFSPHVAFSAGNVLTFAAAGATVRLGGNMPAPVGALVMRPTMSIPYQEGTDRQAGRPAFSWYLYASAEARAVARNIFLDGNSFVESPSVDKNPLVGGFQLGLTLRYGSFGVTYAQNFLTPEFKGQKSLTNYGSLRLSYQF